MWVIGLKCLHILSIYSINLRNIFYCHISVFTVRINVCFAMILQILLDMISLQSKLKLILKPILFLPFLALMILLHCRKLPSEFNVIPSHRIREQNWFCKVMCVYKGQSALLVPFPSAMSFLWRF